MAGCRSQGSSDAKEYLKSKDVGENVALLGQVRRSSREVRQVLATAPGHHGRVRRDQSAARLAVAGVRIPTSVEVRLESTTLESATLESTTLESATLESATLESATLESTRLESAIRESAILESKSALDSRIVDSRIVDSIECMRLVLGLRSNVS